MADGKEVYGICVRCGYPIRRDEEYGEYPTRHIHEKDCGPKAGEPAGHLERLYLYTSWGYDGLVFLPHADGKAKDSGYIGDWVELEAIGQKGWELVQVIILDADEGNGKAIFKRPQMIRE